ncbi:MAG: hypothetical protein R3D27_07615 [Hyphomicrobiaceae bacterium]
MDKVLLETLIAWLPMLILIGVWIYFMRQMRGKGGLTQFEYMEQLLAETRRHNNELEKILNRIDERLARLEQK